LCGEAQGGGRQRRGDRARVVTELSPFDQASAWDILERLRAGVEGNDLEETERIRLLRAALCICAQLGIAAPSWVAARVATAEQVIAVCDLGGRRTVEKLDLGATVFDHVLRLRESENVAFDIVTFERAAAAVNDERGIDLKDHEARDLFYFYRRVAAPYLSALVRLARAKGAKLSPVLNSLPERYIRVLQRKSRNTRR